MNTAINIGLVGDYNAIVPTHQAIPRALALAGNAIGQNIVHEWVPTDEISSADRVAGFDGLWCVPASPYRSMEGAVCAIRFAREEGRPFLGTCGGFQHAVVEYARNVLGWADAEHAETAPEASRLVVTPLHCTLVEATGRVRLRPDSRVAAAYGSLETVEGYHCRYGFNPDFRAALTSRHLRVSAEDESGDVRAVELADHPFFVATLFQPERAALVDQKPPLIVAFAAAVAAYIRASPNMRCI